MGAKNMATQSIGVEVALANGAAASARTAFELRYNQLQNTVIRRLNDEIEKANQVPRTIERKLENFTKENEELSNSISVLDQYRVGVQNIMSNVEKFREQIDVLWQMLGPDGVVSQEEVDAFNLKKTEVLETLNNIPIFKHEGVVDGNVIERLKAQKDLIQSMNPVVGSMDDNEDITFGMLEVQGHVSSAQSVMTTTLGTVLDLEQNMQAEIAYNQAEITEVNTVEQQKKLKRVEELKARYAQFLQGFSTQFEVNQGLITTLNSRLSPQVPPKGSVLNMFS